MTQVESKEKQIPLPPELQAQADGLPESEDDAAIAALNNWLGPDWENIPVDVELDAETVKHLDNAAKGLRAAYNNEQSENGPAPSNVYHPPHYNAHPSGIECIEIVEHFNFNVGNAIKYLWRAGLKSSSAIEDLRKAAWYINREIERKQHYD
jgi:hypothetical protein